MKRANFLKEKFGSIKVYIILYPYRITRELQMATVMPQSVKKCCLPEKSRSDICVCQIFLVTLQTEIDNKSINN